MNSDFPSTVFPDRVLTVSHTCSRNYSVYDGVCTYTRLSHAHFSAHSAFCVGLLIWGFKRPHWHTLVFSDETRIDMRLVCPRDVGEMMVQRARSVSWKKWAAKHEQKGLKEGAWIEPAQAVFRKKTKRGWTENHRNVARKISLEEGRTQKR